MTSAQQSVLIWQGFKHRWTYNHRIARIGSYIRHEKTIRGGVPKRVGLRGLVMRIIGKKPTPLNTPTRGLQAIVGHTGASGWGPDILKYTDLYAHVRGAEDVWFQPEHLEIPRIYCQLRDLTVIDEQFEVVLHEDLHGLACYDVFLNGFDLESRHIDGKLMDFRLEVTAENTPHKNQNNEVALNVTLRGGFRFDCRSLECLVDLAKVAIRDGRLNDAFAMALDLFGLVFHIETDHQLLELWYNAQRFAHVYDAIAEMSGWGGAFDKGSAGYEQFTNALIQLDVPLLLVRDLPDPGALADIAGPLNLRAFEPRPPSAETLGEIIHALPYAALGLHDTPDETQLLELAASPETPLDVKEEALILVNAIRFARKLLVFDPRYSHTVPSTYKLRVEVMIVGAYENSLTISERSWVPDPSIDYQWSLTWPVTNELVRPLTDSQSAYTAYSVPVFTGLTASLNIDPTAKTHPNQRDCEAMHYMEWEAALSNRKQITCSLFYQTWDHGMKSPLYFGSFFAHKFAGSACLGANVKLLEFKARSCDFPNQTEKELRWPGFWVNKRKNPARWDELSKKEGKPIKV